MQRPLMQEWTYTSEVLQLMPPPDIGKSPDPTTPTASDPVVQKHSDCDPDLAL